MPCEQDLENLITQAVEYLKLESEYEELGFLRLLCRAAMEYVQGALDNVDWSSARVMLLELAIISDMYEKRSMTFDIDSTDKKVQYAIRSMINQLQNE